MKRYNKPNTEIYNVELQNMIADSPGLTKTDPINPNLIESKSNDITPSSPNLWDDEEE
jgi:hypothetical protein